MKTPFLRCTLILLLLGVISSVASAGQCLCAGDEAESPVVDDRAIMQGIASQTAALIGRKQSVEGAKLIEQLKRKTTELTLPEQRETASGPIEVYRVAREAVVIVAGVRKCPNCEKPHLTASTASGFAISADGIIVTNHHVVNNNDNETMIVMTADRKVFAVKEVLAADAVNDLAILRTEAKNLKTLPIAAAAKSPIGSPVHVLSHPAGRFYTYTTGVVSRRMKIRNAGKTIDAVAITADYARGSSGAPVMNDHGQVVAVVKSTESIGATHHSDDGKEHESVQMVFKVCIPAENILDLIK